MSIWRRLGILMLSLVSVGAGAADDFRPVFQKGLTFTHGYRERNNLQSSSSQESLRYLRRQLNTEWVALNPFGYQRTVTATDIRFGGDPRDDLLRQGIAQAHDLGLKVMLKPHIWLGQQGGDDWRGTIGFDSDEAWLGWFSNYERFILHYARIAAQTETEIFCIGVELSRAATQRPQDWRRLIAKIRAVYPGPLTYAANWWGDYDLVEFWDDLDYIGINAFFPLTQAGEAEDLTTLRAGARRVADTIEQVQLRVDKPVLLTEVGFRSVRGATVRPWEWPKHDVGAIDLGLQQRGYQAILEAFWPREWFYGLYWWKWHSDLRRGGVNNNGFTPRHKLAESTIADWFRRPSPRP